MRHYKINTATCSECGDDMHIIASIEDLKVIGKTLAHLDAIATSAGTRQLPECPAPPAPGLLV
jgi:hypothetical protein